MSSGLVISLSFSSLLTLEGSFWSEALRHDLVPPCTSYSLDVFWICSAKQALFGSFSFAARERILILSRDEAFCAKVASFSSVLIKDLSDLISAEYFSRSALRSLRDNCSEDLSLVLVAFSWLIFLLALA